MESYMVEFHDMSCDKVHDLQLPAQLTGDELVNALQKAYQLNINVNDPCQLYLRAENPVALLTGEHTLQELGVSNGTSIFFDPREA